MPPPMPAAPPLALAMTVPPVMRTSRTEPLSPPPMPAAPREPSLGPASAVMLGDSRYDGVGALDPVFVVLPNSGLLVRYNMLLGLNADGTPNQEAGTTPDLLSPAGEHPLITALRSILS